MGLFPVFATGTQCANAAQDPATCDWYLDGGIIKLHRGGQNVNFELRMADWGVPAGADLTVYGGTFDCATFNFDKTGSVEPVGVECALEADPIACIGFGQAINFARPDFVFTGLPHVDICDTISLCPGSGEPGFYKCYAVAGGVFGAPDPGVDRYGADMSVLVSGDALGVANVGLIDDDDESFLTDFNGAEIPLVSLTSGTIEILQGSCCTGVGTPQLACTPDLSFDQCQALDGRFNEGGDCACCIPGEVPGPTCSDGIDNDCDGLIDCDDSDCATDPACSGPAVPTISQWGLIVMALLLLAGAKISSSRRQAT